MRRDLSLFLFMLLAVGLAVAAFVWLYNRDADAGGRRGLPPECHIKYGPDLTQDLVCSVPKGGNDE